MTYVEARNPRPILSEDFINDAISAYTHWLKGGDPTKENLDRALAVLFKRERKIVNCEVDKIQRTIIDNLDPSPLKDTLIELTSSARRFFL